jgi:DNA-directed RNA polymerase specialized sigma24 family protein
MESRWNTRGLAAENAGVVAELYPSLWEFAAVAAGAGAKADDLIVDTLSWAIPIRSLHDLDEPALEVRRLMVERLGRRVPGSRREAHSERTRATRLAVRARAAAYLDEVEGRDSATIGRIIGCSPGAAERLSRRTGRRIRRDLREERASVADVLRDLAADADPAGIDDVMERLDDRLSALSGPVTIGVRPSDDGGRRTGTGRGPIVAAGLAVGAVALVAGIGSMSPGAVTTPSPSEPRPAEPRSLTAQPPQEARPPVTLAPPARGESVRYVTAIGELEFATLAYSPLDWYSGLVPTPYGPVAAPGLRWSDDYTTWEDVMIGHPFVTGLGDDVLTYGSIDLDGRGIGVRLAWTGDGWIEAERLELPGPVDRIVVGPNGAVGVDETQLVYTGERWEYGPQLVFYRSADGVRFTEATQPPAAIEAGGGPDRPVPRPARTPVRFGGFAGDCAPSGWSTGSDPIHAAADGFLALTAGHPADWGITPICEPQVWFSADGDVWEQVGGPAPFGPSAAVSAVAYHDGRFAAIGAVGTETAGGAEPALWASTDGIAWQRVDIELPLITAIGAGELGWVVVGFERLGGDIDMWVSPDAYTWDGPHDLSPVFGPARKPQQIVAGPDEIVILAERGLTLGRPYQPAQNAGDGVVAAP